MIKRILIFGLAIFGGYKFLISDLQLERERVEAKEITLKEQFKKKAFEEVVGGNHLLSLPQSLLQINANVNIVLKM